jgi:hypothetical protein
MRWKRRKEGKRESTEDGGDDLHANGSDFLVRAHSYSRII